MDDHRLRVGPSDFGRVDPDRLAERAGARAQADGARVTTVGDGKDNERCTSGPPSLYR